MEQKSGAGMTEELLPCPFDNGEAILYDSLEYLGIVNYIPVAYGIKCSVCACKMEFYLVEDKHLLIEAWNKRT